MNNMLKNKNCNKWINKDVAELLVNSIKNKKHNVSFENCNKLKGVDFVKSLQDRLSYKYMNICKTSKEKQYFEVKEKIYNNSIITHIYNHNNLATTDVSIFVRGICDSSSNEKPGCYYSILNYQNVEKEITKSFIHTTSNRMILQGAIDAIKLLKRPCNIKLFIHSSVGLLKFNKEIKSVNSDLCKELFELLKKNNHSLEEIISKTRQKELQSKITYKYF